MLACTGRFADGRLLVRERFRPMRELVLTMSIGRRFVRLIRLIASSRGLCQPASDCANRAVRIGFGLVQAVRIGFRFSRAAPTGRRQLVSGSRGLYQLGGVGRKDSVVGRKHVTVVVCGQIQRVRGTRITACLSFGTVYRKRTSKQGSIARKYPVLLRLRLLFFSEHVLFDRGFSGAGRVFSQCPHFDRECSGF